MRLHPLESLPLDAREYGGKATALASLRRAGYAVPPGFCIGASALDVLAEGVRRRAPLLFAAEALSGLAAARRLESLAAAEAAREALPAELASAISAAFLRLTTGIEGLRVAVRSSAPEEDSLRASFAGQHESCLDVSGGAELLAAVKRVWASSYSAAALCYRRRVGIEAPPRMAVLVQRMVRCRVAGVLFTRDPVQPGGGMRLEVVRGEARSLVDGHGADETWTCSVDGCCQRVEGRDAPLLGPETLRQLFALARRVERERGAPQDVEWAVEDGEPVLLQARPITTLRERTVA